MAIDSEDLKQLEKSISDAIGGVKDGPNARKQKKLALQKLAHETAGVKIQTLENTKRKALVKSLTDSKKGYKELDKDLKDIRDSFEELNDSVRAVRSSLRSFGSAAYTGTGSISEFTESLRGSSEVLNFIADLGKTFDVNADTFRGLSEVGGNFNQSIVQMRNAAAQAALPLDDFAKLIRDNSTTLAALYGTTTQGAIGIAGLGEALRTQATPELASLGFTVDEINETLITNLDRQRRTGIFDRMTDQQRVQSAANFAKELDRLAKLTGQQRSELRAQLDQQASNARFAAFIRTQDDDTQRRLSGFAATIGAVSPMLSEGMEDLIANAGVPVTDAALQLVQNFPEVQKTVRSLIAGTVSSEQALVQMKNMSVKSLDRFSKAAATGQVEFTALTPGIVALAGLTLDQVAALKEQGIAIAGGTSSLMQFQENAKRLSAATQSLETGFYSMLGRLGGEGTDSVVGAIGDMSDKFVTGTTDFTKALLYGSKSLTKMGLNLLRDTLPTYTAVYTATLAANLKGGGFFKGMTGGKGFGGAGKMLGKAGGIGLGAIGVSQFSQLAGKEGATKGEQTAGVLGSAASGALSGAMIGSMILPGWGTAIGGALGGIYGGYKAYSGTKYIGGDMASGVPYLTGERGPEIITPNVASNVTSNANLNSALNITPLETKMASMVTELTSTNKKLTNMVDSVNMLVGVNSKIARSTEGTYRNIKNVSGQVLQA